MSSTKQPKESSEKMVPAVMRTVVILDKISSAGGGMKLVELVRATGFPKSSLHGLCQTLVHSGLLRLKPDGSFVMGPKSVRWADAFLRTVDILDAFHEALSEEAAFNSYTLTFSQLEAQDVIYLACRNSTAPLGITFRRGMRAPAVFTATGKAMLACMDPDARIKHLPTLWPGKLTPSSVSSIEELEVELKDIAAKGYSIDNGQLREGMLCIGAAVCDADAQPVAGIALSMLEAEAASADIDLIGSEIVQLAESVAAKMGWRECHDNSVT